LSSGGVEFLELAIVKVMELLSNGSIEFRQAEESVVPERRQDPAFSHKYC
jgi:hypothetical protein